MPAHAELLKKYPEATSKEYKENTKPQSGKRHVVISTKYEDPWFGISVKVKSALIQQGCTVYNPNTDNLSLYHGDKSKADSAWLLTFNNNLEDVKNFEGFVMQIQQGIDRLKSDMQLAEEKQAGWLDVPRIGVWFTKGQSSDLTSYMKDHVLPCAVELAASQWEKRSILPYVQMANETYEAVPGHAGNVGSRNGYLKITFPDGGCYEGQCVNGKIQGQGILRCALDEGDRVQEVYEGEWKDGEQHGRGRKQYVDGDVYEGQWQNGEEHGKGKTTYADGSLYEGEYKDGAQHGHGKFACADGSLYEGEYKDGARHGHGKTACANGSLYEGEYKDGARHGHGKFTYRDGESYNGQWQSGKKHGKGVFKYKFENVEHVEHGEWRDGEMIEEEVVGEGAGSTNQSCQSPDCILA